MAKKKEITIDCTEVNVAIEDDMTYEIHIDGGVTTKTKNETKEYYLQFELEYDRDEAFEKLVEDVVQALGLDPEKEVDFESNVYPAEEVVWFKVRDLVRYQDKATLTNENFNKPW